MQDHCRFNALFRNLILYSTTVQELHIQLITANRSSVCFGQHSYRVFFFFTGSHSSFIEEQALCHDTSDGKQEQHNAGSESHSGPCLEPPTAAVWKLQILNLHLLRLVHTYCYHCPWASGFSPQKVYEEHDMSSPLYHQVHVQHCFFYFLIPHLY